MRPLFALYAFRGWELGGLLLDSKPYRSKQEEKR